MTSLQYFQIHIGINVYFQAVDNSQPSWISPTFIIFTQSFSCCMLFLVQPPTHLHHIPFPSLFPTLNVTHFYCHYTRARLAGLSSLVFDPIPFSLPIISKSLQFTAYQRGGEGSEECNYSTWNLARMLELMILHLQKLQEGFNDGVCCQDFCLLLIHNTAVPTVPSNVSQKNYLSIWRWMKSLLSLSLIYTSITEHLFGILIFCMWMLEEKFKNLSHKNTVLDGINGVLYQMCWACLNCCCRDSQDIVVNLLGPADKFNTYLTCSVYIKYHPWMIAQTVWCQSKNHPRLQWLQFTIQEKMCRQKCYSTVKFTLWRVNGKRDDVLFGDPIPPWSTHLAPHLPSCRYTSFVPLIPDHNLAVMI